MCLIVEYVGEGKQLNSLFGVELFFMYEFMITIGSSCDAPTVLMERGLFGNRILLRLS